MNNSFVIMCAFLILALGPDGGDAPPTNEGSFIVHPIGISRAGHTVTLTCNEYEPSAMSRPSSYVWIKNEITIPGETGVNLTLTNLTKQDEGYYECGDQHSDLPRWKYQLSLIRDPLPRPIIFHGSFPVAYRPYMLACDLKNEYIPNNNTVYAWYKARTEVKGETGRWLRFSKLTEADEGEYVCTAREGAVETTSPSSAEYYLKPLVAPEVHIKPTSNGSVVKGILGESLKLTCEVTRAFPPVPMEGYSWSYLPSNQDQGQLLEERSSTLTLSPLTRNHSGQYQCQARNDQVLPSLNLTCSASVTINVVDPRRGTPQHGTIYTKESAPFNFLLPKQTAVVIVHPTGEDIIIFFPNCSYVISEVFRPRCLETTCDLADYHVSFILTELTEKDGGNYICLKLEEEMKEIPKCIRTLILKGQMSGKLHPVFVPLVTIAVIFVVVVVVVVVVVIVKCIIQHGFPGSRIVRILSPQRCRNSMELKPLLSCLTPLTETRMLEESHSFERLYKNGKIYVFPTSSSDGKTAEATPMLSEDNALPVGKLVCKIKDLIIRILTERSGEDDLPCFFLHNMRLSRQEKVGLILSRTLGVIVTVFAAVDKVEQIGSFEGAMKHLIQAKNLVSDKLKGLVKPEEITAAMALPNLPDADKDKIRHRVEVFRSNADVNLLLGLEGDHFHQLAERLSSRPDSQVWDLSTPGVDNPDSAFKMAARKFLTLAGSLRPEESPKRPTAAEIWLLTPAQMEVRDSTARMLHVWGPPGSGKTMLLLHRARQWLADGKAVILAVGREVYDVLLQYVVKGVMRDQKKSTQERIRVCHKHKALEVTVADLRGQYPDIEICLIIETLQDAELFSKLLNVVESKQVNAIWTVCRNKHDSVDTELSKTAEGLGWESVKLPESIRCTEAIAKLLNQLGQGTPHHYPVISCTVPRNQNISSFHMVDHSEHHHPQSSTSACVQCKTELSTVLPVSDESPRWNDWVALCTGNPNVLTDLKPLCATLRELDVPASIDRHYDVVASHGSRFESNEQDVARWLERAMNGVDEKGKPTVHLVRVRDLAGVEKEGILLVHWDGRDNDPNYQSQEDKDTRLEEHRDQWALAAARCRSQVVFLLLTPSPARSLLNC